LVDGYAACADARDVDGFRGLFTEDAVLTVVEPDGTVRPPNVGLDVIAQIPVRLGRYERTRHVVGEHRVEGGPGPDEATGTVACEAHHHRRGTDTVMTITYEDRYRRTDAGWRIAGRTVRIEHRADRPVSDEEAAR
jgi:3-phenylpropionate/cinnamic acid dioxygenase small subunit